jgi:DNA polymerase III subunit epsilon
LVEEFARCGLRFELAGRAVLDVFQIFREMQPRDLEGAMAFYCGRPYHEAHVAHNDADAAALVLDAQLACYRELPRDVQSLHERFAGVDLMGQFRCEQGEVVFNFGRHLGRPLHEVAWESPEYLEWMLGGNFLDDVKQMVRAELERARPCQRS